MLIRSLALATLFAASAPLFAADADSPLAKDRGHSRAVVVIIPKSGEQDLKNLQEALKEPANQQAFNQRNMVLYTMDYSIGRRNGVPLDAQDATALVRGLNLGAFDKTRTFLYGKDGERYLEKEGPVTPQDLFTAVDQMPAGEKNAAAAAPQAPAAEPGAAAPAKGKAGKAAAPPAGLDD